MVLRLKDIDTGLAVIDVPATAPFYPKSDDLNAGALACVLLDVNGNPAGGGVTYTDRSGSITTGGTAQNAAAANSVRRGMWVQNTSGADMRVSASGAASATDGILVAPGQILNYPPNGVPVTAISVWGATTGQTFEAAEW